MSLLKIFIFFAMLALVLPGGASADEQAEELKTVTATGAAGIKSGNTAFARDAAVNDALRKAVEQAVGTVVSSETMVENYSVLSDNIYTRTKGYVKDYTIVGESYQPDLYQVTVVATIAVTDIRKDLASLGLLMKKAGKPRILFMIAEKQIGRKYYNFWWWGKSEYKGEVMELSVAENALKEAFLNGGFHVVDISGSTGKFVVKDQYRIADLTKQAATELGRDLNAEVVVYGRAQVTEGPRTEGSDVGVYIADVSAQAVRVDDGVVLGVSTGHGTARHISEITGQTQSLTKAADELADKLTAQIVAKLDAVKSVTIRLFGTTDYKEVTEFTNLLKMRIRGIETIYQRRYDGDHAVIEVDSKSGAKDIADEIGRFGLLRYRVIGATANTVDVRYRSEK